MGSKGYNAPGQLPGAVKRAKKYKRETYWEGKEHCYWGKYFKPHGDVVIKCLNCLADKQVKYKERARKFCSPSCSSTYNNIIRWNKVKENAELQKDGMEKNK